MANRTLRLVHLRDGQSHQIEMLDDGRVRVDDRIYQVRAEGKERVRIDGDRTTWCWIASAGDTRWVFLDGRVYELADQPPQARVRRGSHRGSLSAPMPATVRRVLVKEGDAVTSGESLIVLEAMKMELPVRAASAGIIRTICCREGELVQAGVTLVEMDEK